MELKALLHKSWLPLAKGAGRALALAEGLLVAVIIATALRAAPTYAAEYEPCVTGGTDKTYTVKINWNDDNNKYGMRPNSVVVNYSQCGVSNSLVVTDASGWVGAVVNDLLPGPSFTEISSLPSGYTAEKVDSFTFNVIYTPPQPSLTLAPPTNIALNPTVGGITYGSHNLSIAAQNLQGYNATLAIAPDHGPNLTLDGTGKGSDTTKLFSPVGSNKLLANKQWGYTLTKVDDTNKATAIWNNIKDQSSNPTSDIIIPEAESNGDGTVTKTVYYGARLDDTSDLTKGSYSTQVQYTVTGIPEPEEAPADLGGEVCRSGDVYNSCKVDIDANMIPVKYTGDATNPKWTAIANPEGTNNKGEWYDYSQKQWANAVTLSTAKSYKFGFGCFSIQKVNDGSGDWSALQMWSMDASELSTLVYRDECDSLGKIETIEKYRSSNAIDPADVLGYWVYIPRYAYQVMRRDATDKVVTDEKAIEMGGFNIRFQKSPSISTDTKERIVEPKKCDNSNVNQYYQGCVNGWEAWATHPAFRWCTNINYETGERGGCTELNGIWVGKFETTGEIAAPTVKPGVTSLRNQTIGKMFDAAKKVGVEDTNAVGGIDSGSTQNSHNLSTAKSHMLKNSEWGATTYLSASKYGTGVNNVEFNANNSGTTGCGPIAEGDVNSGSACNAYNTTLGQTASTTGNVTGVYDMAGGVWDYVMGSLSTDTNQVANDFSNYYGTAIKPPYVDLYPTSVFTNNDHLANTNQCSWATCGGHALHETKNEQLLSGYYQSWGNDGADFIATDKPWFLRGECHTSTDNSALPGIFATGTNTGIADQVFGFRIALLAQ